MEFDVRPIETEDRSFRMCVTALAVLILLIVVLQFPGVRHRAKPEAGGGDREAVLRAGDFSSKSAIGWPSGQFTSLALKSYTKALPWHIAYRRLGLLKQSYGQSGLADFKMVDSPAATRHLDKKKIAELHSEKAMWLHIYGPGELTAQDARRYIREVRTLDVGPLRDIAIADIYNHAGQPKKAERLVASTRSAARHDLIIAGLLFLALCLGALVGLVIAVMSFASWGNALAAAPRSALKSSSLLISFIAYLSSYICLGVVLHKGTDALGVEAADALMGALIASAALAFVIGLRVLVRRVGPDWREVGFRAFGVGRSVLWGIGGFCAASPFIATAALISLALSKTIFRHIPTPEQPFGGIISEGGALEIVLVYLAASVVAPIVEETFFRGVLYTAFRGKMGVWPSVFVTSAIFAVIHPLPGGFLPIFAFACVLALLRERSGSLLPGMICHGIYNTVGLLLVTLIS